MVIGIDFDNTIVCYDEVFRKAAIERSLSLDVGASPKHVLHDYLHQSGNVEEWIALQGEVYGPLMRDATPFPGVLDFFRRCRADSVAVRIISHRTRYPYRGALSDLHQAARDWLTVHGFHDVSEIGLPIEHVFFELNRRDKLGRVASEGCTHFIDDLPTVLAEPEFPTGVRKILFDPHGTHPNFPLALHTDSWTKMDQLL